MSAHWKPVMDIGHDAHKRPWICVQYEGFKRSVALNASLNFIRFGSEKTAQLHCNKLNRHPADAAIDKS